MAYKNKEDRIKYDREYYLKVKKSKYIPHPRVKKTKEEKLATKRAWMRANPEKVKEMTKQSREKHKEQRKLDTKLWAEKNRKWLKEYHAKYNKKWYQENKESNDKRSKKWTKNNPKQWQVIAKKYSILHKEDIVERDKRYNKTLKGRYKVLRNGAKHRNRKLELSFEQFCEIVERPCIYCGETEKRIGIDRTDNTIGYTKKNSAPCCTVCNFMKRTMTKKDFLLHIDKVYNYQHKYASNE